MVGDYQMTDDWTLEGIRQNASGLVGVKNWRKFTQGDACKSSFLACLHRLLVDGHKDVTAFVKSPEYFDVLARAVRGCVQEQDAVSLRRIVFFHQAIIIESGNLKNGLPLVNSIAEGLSAAFKGNLRLQAGNPLGAIAEMSLYKAAFAEEETPELGSVP